MVYLESSSTDPYFNLALEEYVFEKMNPSKQYFMLWQNDKTIVVGKYQNTAEEINRQFVEEHGIRVARRLSGGGAVYHDKGNLNFTFVIDQADSPDFNFQIFVRPVVQALEKLGITAQFNGRNDITIDGLKFSGNSQYARHGRLLHHGCIMLDSNLTNVSDALRVKESKFTSKAAKSVRSRVTTINAHAPVHISMEQFKQVLKDCVLADSLTETYTLTESDLAEILILRNEKYATWRWIYGMSPAYNVRRELKFPAGLITAYLTVIQGCIQDVHFYGDFFGNGDIHELERSLHGLRLDENLTQALRERHIGQYFLGISPEELSELLCG